MKKRWMTVVDGLLEFFAWASLLTLLIYNLYLIWKLP